MSDSTPPPSSLPAPDASVSSPPPDVRTVEEGGVRATSLVAAREGGDAADAATPSNAIDPFEGLYGATGNLLVPPFRYETINYLYNDSDVLQEAIDIMARNVTGYGYQFVAREGATPESEKEAALAEKRRLDRWWRYATLDAFTEHWKKTWIDYELYGDAYTEVQRNRKGEVAGLTHVPAFTVRKGKRDTTPTLVERWVLDPEGQWTKRPHWRYFRRFAQNVHGELRYFKEFGDPRKIRADNGQLDASLPDDSPDLAHEMLNFCNYAPDSAYGKPRWRGATNAVVGRSAAMAVNADYFDNKTIPPLLVAVEGAALSPKTHKLIADHFRGLRGRENFHRVLILEAVMQGGLADGDRPTAVPRIHVEDLRLKATTEGQFLTYGNQCATDVMCAFSLPPLFSGRTPGYNRATADAQKVVAEEQAFAPPREIVSETMNREIMPELDAQYWDFRLRPAPLLNEETLERMLKLGIEAGVLTPAQAAEVLEGVLGRELSIEDAWADVPVLVLREILKRGQVPVGMAAVFENAGGTDPNAPPGGSGGVGATDGGDGASEGTDAPDEAPEGDGAGTATTDAATTDESERVVQARGEWLRSAEPTARRGSA